MATISSLSSPSSCGPITTQEFNAFHAHDRALYARLIFELRRDPAESMRVIGLLLWLERIGSDFSLVKWILSTEGDFVNALAEEAMTCLACAGSDEFRVDPDRNGSIPLLRGLLGTGLSLGFFHENRVAVLSGVTKIVSEVCVRAFEDILRRPFGSYHCRDPVLGVGSSDGGGMAPVVVVGSGGGSGSGGGETSRSGSRGGGLRMLAVPFYPPIGVVPNLGFTGNFVAPVMGPIHHHQHHGGVSWNEMGVVPNQMMVAAGGEGGGVGVDYQIQGGGSYGSYWSYDYVNEQRQFLNQELGQLLGSLTIGAPAPAPAPAGVEEEEREVPAHERTIFLTFSKGYPISDNEVWEFFTRKFGDIFEAIHMQEVTQEEQALYARLVARSASAIPAILGGQRKARFTIKGRHLWARKYERREP